MFLRDRSSPKFETTNFLFLNYFVAWKANPFKKKKKKKKKERLKELLPSGDFGCQALGWSQFLWLN